MADLASCRSFGYAKPGLPMIGNMEQWGGLCVLWCNLCVPESGHPTTYPHDNRPGKSVLTISVAQSVPPVRTYTNYLMEFL